MNRRFGILLLVVATFGAWTVACSGSPSEKNTFITVGTGGLSGVYYPTGGAIAKLVNTNQKTNHLKASVESTGGSVFNINGVIHQDLTFGIAQSDREYQAFNGLGEWKEIGAQTDLRTVFSIYPEAVTLVAAEDAGIKTIQDLRGKRVNIGNPGSGTRENAIQTLEAAGINYKTDLQAESAKASEAPGLLQDGRIDAFFYTVGHPSGAIKEATAGLRKVGLIPITHTTDLINKKTFYTPAVIDISQYPGATNEENVSTYGVKAVLVTSQRVPTDVVYNVTKEIFENLDAFKASHPALAQSTRESMLEGLSSPVHPGAMKYFKEAGLK